MGAKELKIALWTDFEEYIPGHEEYAHFSQIYHYLREHGVEITLPRDLTEIDAEETPSEEDLEHALEESTHVLLVNPGGLEQKMHHVIEKAREHQTPIYLTERPEKRNGAGYAPVKDFLRFHLINPNYETPPQARTPYLSAWKSSPQSEDESRTTSPNPS